MTLAPGALVYTYMMTYFTDKKASNCIRGIAALFIMLGHICGDMPLWFRYLFSGEMWVGIFFFYSGYGLRYSYVHKKDYLKGFLWRKIIGIYLPFLVAESIYTICYSLRGEHLTITDTILGCLGIRLYNNVLWYVVELLAINLIFYIWNRFAAKNGWDYIWIIGYVIFLAAAVLCDLGTWWYISTSTFVLGMFWDRIITRFDFYEKHRYLQIVLVAAFVVAYGIYKTISINMNADRIAGLPVNYVLTALAMVLIPVFVLTVMTVSYWLRSCSVLVNATTNFLGEISYEIYLYHLVAAMLITVSVYPAVKIIIIVAATILISKAMNMIKNKVLP